jgi:hypothetical protein
LLPTLTPVTSYSIATSDYRKMYNQQPLSNKQHYIDWMVGVPYKTYKYDKFQNLLVATEQEYTVYVNQINNDNALNLNISPSLFGKTKPQNSTEWIPKQYCTSDKFNFDFYHLLTGRMELKSNSVKTYQDNVHYLEKKIEYEYDPSNGYPRKTIETLPNNVVVEERQFYSSDNNNWNNNTAMVSLTNANKTRVIHSETWRQEPGQTMKLLDASGGGYIEVQGKVHSNINYHLKGSTLLTTSPIVTNVFSQADADQGITIPGFEKGSIYTKYDVLGNPCEVSYKGKNNASIYDYYQDALLATVSNSTYNEMAYSSFESNIYKTDYNAADFEYDKGNWRFFTQGLKRNFGITGKNCYDLNATYDETIGNVFTTKPVEIHSASNVELVIGKKYIISFWRKQTANVSILNYDTSPASSTPVTYTTYMTNVSTLQAINGWTFCQAEFTAQHKRIKISGDALIDELRLYPADASMLTSCFTPIYGKMSECDAGNNIQHFEYDEVERVHITRDGKGNIRSKSKTAKQLQD